MARFVFPFLVLCASVLTTSDAAGSEALDLGGDTDRSGFIDDSALEEQLEATQSVIVLNNCDDDDEDSAADNLDNVINGPEDEKDFEEVVLRQVEALPGGPVSLQLRPRSADGTDPLQRVRVTNGEGDEILGPSTSDTYSLTAAELQELTEGEMLFFVEGLTFATSSELVVRLNDQDQDSLILEVAPFLLLPHNRDAKENYVVELTHSDDKLDSQSYVLAFEDAVSMANVEPVPLKVFSEEGDVWIEDEMSWGYTETPRVQMPVVLHMPRGGELSDLHDAVKDLMKPGIGYFRAFDYPEEWSELDFGGNLEVTPPVAGHRFGRIYYGSLKSTNNAYRNYYRRKINSGFQEFFERQGQQASVDLSTDWLWVGHIDEVVTFIPKAGGGFRMLLASPELAVATLREMGESETLDSRYDDYYGAPTVGDLLAKNYYGVSSAEFNGYVDARIFGPVHSNPSPSSIKGTMMRELGLEESDIEEVPVLFENHPGAEAATPKKKFAAVALTPGMVNLSSMGKHVLAPNPFIPEFQDLFEDALTGTGASVAWIDNWWLYHRGNGEVHCGSNEKREFFKAHWWE